MVTGFSPAVENQSETTPHPELRSERYWAGQLDIHPATLARARKVGKVDYYRVGDRVLYAQNQIAAFLETLERSAGGGK